MKKFGKGISGTLVSLAFIFVMFAATSNTAQAQYSNQRRDDRYGNNQGDWRRNRDQNRNHDNNRNDGRYRRNRGYGNNGGYNQIELDRGYQQGLNTGASDGQRGQSYNPQRSRYFKNASSQAFRQGFVQGYDQGFQQYSRNRNQRNRQSNGNGNNGWGNILGGILNRP
jgi:hypothetical protein